MQLTETGKIILSGRKIKVSPLETGFLLEIPFLGTYYRVEVTKGNEIKFAGWMGELDKFNRANRAYAHNRKWLEQFLRNNTDNT
jgi:hypothetical protein